MAVLPELGHRYHVEIGDCCVEGEFTATVTEIEHDIDEFAWDTVVKFDNGVTLTRIGKVTFEECPDEG